MRNISTHLSRVVAALALGGTFWLMSLGALAQSVGIGTTAPDASTAVEVVSSSKGALLPRITQAARTGMGVGMVAPPAAGMVVYQTDGAQPVFWYNI